MEKSDVRYDTVELSLPTVINSFRTLQNQVGIWKCSLSRYDDKEYGSSSFFYIVVQKKMELFEYF